MILTAILVIILSMLLGGVFIWLGWMLWHVKEMEIICSEEGVRMNVITRNILVIL